MRCVLRKNFFEHVYQLETERLWLAPFSRGDESILHQLFIDPFIRKYLWDDVLLTPEQSQEVLETNIRHFEQDQWGLWKIQDKDTGKVMGFTGLWYFFDEPQPQLLYGILEKYTSQGYASEAASQIIEYAFDTLSFKYLIAAMDAPHKVSQKLAQRIGMSFYEEKVEEGKSTIFYKISKPLA